MQWRTTLVPIPEVFCCELPVPAVKQLLTSAWLMHSAQGINSSTQTGLGFGAWEKQQLVHRGMNWKIGIIEF